MRKRLFSEVVPAVDIQGLPFDVGPTVFVRLCAALIAKALKERLGSITVPAVSERLNVPDHGVDAEMTLPDSGAADETEGLIGPGRTVFQFKYRDVTSAKNRGSILRTLARRLCNEFPRAAATCQRYVLLLNLDVSGAERRKIEQVLHQSYPAFQGRIVVWGASEIATVLNANPDLRHVFFSEGKLSTRDVALDELKNAYSTVGWPSFVDRQRELTAVADFVQDPEARVLEVIGPRYSGKTRLVLEALNECPRFVIWAATPDSVDIGHFRDFDISGSPILLVIDRCDESVARNLVNWARSRHSLKTVLIREGSDTSRSMSSLVISVGPLPADATQHLVASIVPGASFLRQSWVHDASEGLPGLVLHVAALLRKAKLRISSDPREILARLDELLDREYLQPLTAEARGALAVISMLPIVGVTGKHADELDALCRALEEPVASVRRELPGLERLGLVRRRGSFIAVQPPRLAALLASKALRHPDLDLAVFRVVLPEERAYLRFLERVRDLWTDDVRSAVERLFASGKWFADLGNLASHVRVLEILAPAAPGAALRRVQEVFSSCQVDDLRSGLTGEARNALVRTLDRLTLRNDTFAGAAECLLLLAEGEGARSESAASTIFLQLFHWKHPELPASYQRRGAILAAGASSASAERRRIIALACGKAFSPRWTFQLHASHGVDLPEDCFASRWADALQYAGQVRDVLQRLSFDLDPIVACAAKEAYLAVFREFVEIAARADASEQFAARSFQLLRDLAETATSSRERVEAQSALARAQHWLRTRWLEIPQAEERIRLLLKAADTLHRQLLGTDELDDRLWRWVGPGRWRSLRYRRVDAEVEEALNRLAADFVSAPGEFARRLEWLTGDEAKGAPRLMRRIGATDRGGPLYIDLVRSPSGPYWTSAFSVYLFGWAQNDPAAAYAALDALIDTRRDLGIGLLAATCELHAADIGNATVDRLRRLLAARTIDRTTFAHELALRLRWSGLPADAAQRLLETLDDSTSEVRRSLLIAFVDLHDQGAGLTPALRRLAWSYLRSTADDLDETFLHSWDALAATLAQDEDDKLLALLDEVFAEMRTRRSQHLSLEYDLPQVWETLKEKRRATLLEMVLRHALAPGTSPWIDTTLETLIEPDRDGDILSSLIERYGLEAARAVALAVDVGKPGFWILVREIMARSGGDELVAERLSVAVTSGTWSGSAISVIDERLEEVARLTKDPNPSVQTWAGRVVSELQEWRRRAQREEEEDWLWDFRIRRVEMETMLRSGSVPERLWAIGRLLEDAPITRVLELLRPEEILEALPKLPQLDESTRAKWEGWARQHAGPRH